ncbi:ASCH domain-containing protein [Candidatus Woesearchaeota archaeon]|nr:ASCH domain-containing protein [Candidatus Woesearchaeota archaeon]
MHHVAILAKHRELLPKIISGEKTIESRWYTSRYPPWNKVSVGDKVFFKDSGEAISASATISKVLQFTDVDKPTCEKIFRKYGKDICLKDMEYSSYYQAKNYCILLFLENIESIEPFHIDKSGFGNAAAWLCVDDISQIKQ